MTRTVFDELVQRVQEISNQGSGSEDHSDEQFGQNGSKLRDPFDALEWERRSAQIVNPQTGEQVFMADALEFPVHWSHNCTALVAEKYFRHVLQPDGKRVRETSVKQMISRVANTITTWGCEQGWLVRKSSEPGRLRSALVDLLVNQRAAFNSPVWFNVGVEGGQMGTEQCSACFINEVEDNMESILDLAVTEGLLYKGGSGSGVNYSKLRSSKERLSGGGFASGPVPFIAKDDFNAGAVKSGGTTRRAAKMAILNVDHLDIVEFIQAKVDSERAAWVLSESGFSNDFRARWGAYAMVPFQNANHSVRVTNEFMEAVEADRDWNLRSRTGWVIETVKARSIWEQLCSAAHLCGDPGLQFDTTINDWHTCPESGRINASNPCSEFMFLDNTACNLASLNLLKFLQEDGTFDTGSFVQAVDALITAMEILVDGAAYPTPKIQAMSHKFRPLGLGYSNLGALLMAQGIPYDSDEARSYAGAITSLMTAQAYRRSAELARADEPFAGYGPNKHAMGRVIEKHLRASRALLTIAVGEAKRIADLAVTTWCSAELLGQEHGYRHSQVTVLAPAGTISFLMDCDTTGVEPELALVKHKKLVGGGTIKIVNRQAVVALRKLGYAETAIGEISQYVQQHSSLVGAPGFEEQHLAVFDTSLPDPVGGRFIRPEAHVLMVAAVQPFLSGAVSKTVNVPEKATKADIERLYMLAWRSGTKAVALYRDGSKKTQPLDQLNQKAHDVPEPLPIERRRKLPTDCMTHRHKFHIGQHDGYVHVGLYPDGTPGEVFIKMSKAGSTIQSLMDSVAMLTSISLQYGVPLEVLVDKFSYTQFEPSGITHHEVVRFAQSPLDYIFRWLQAEYLTKDRDDTDEETVVSTRGKSNGTAVEVGLTCGRCGNPAQKTGPCTTCATCGWTEGCG